MRSPSRVGVSFVCLGNICRSPTAEAIFLAKLDEAGLRQRFRVDSAGTGGWHVGERADPRTRAAARARGIDIQSRGRQFERADFGRFDHIVAMDRKNLAQLEELAPPGAARGELHLFRRYEGSPTGQAPPQDVPDPYLEGGFDHVFDICERAATGLLAYLVARHDLV